MTARATYPAECPWCGWEMSPWARRHLVVCPRNPALRPHIVAALTDPKRPGCAVGPRIYARRSAGFRAPSASLLYRAWGNWEAVAAEFGLHCESRSRGRVG